MADLEPFVLFLDGRRGEKRVIENIDEVLPQIQSILPGMPLAIATANPQNPYIQRVLFSYVI